MEMSRIPESCAFKIIHLIILKSLSQLHNLNISINSFLKNQQHTLKKYSHKEIIKSDGDPNAV